MCREGKQSTQRNNQTTMQVKFSSGKAIQSNQLDNYTISYDQFLKFLTRVKEVDKKTSLPYFCGGHYSDKTRHEESLESRTLIVLDVDEYNGTITELDEEVNKAIGKYQYICYSTFRHKPENPRIRIVLFPSQEIDLKHYREVIKFLATTLPCTIDDCSYSSSYAFFTGGFMQGSPYSPYFRENKGELVNIESILANKIIDAETPTTTYGEKSITDEGFKLTLNLTHEEVKKYMDYYKPEELNYKTWVNVGMMIHHETLGSKTGRLIWREWSKKNFKKDSQGIAYTDKRYDTETLGKWETFNNSKDNTLTFKAIKSAVDKTHSIEFLSVKTKPGEIYNLDVILHPNSFVHVSDKLAIRETVENVEFLLKAYGMKVRHNLISNDKEITIEKEQKLFKNSYNLDTKLARILSICHQCNFKIRESNLDKLLNIIAEDNHYNPILEFIKSKPWDGVSRLQALYDTVPSDSDIKQLLMRKWFLSAVAACNVDMFKTKGVLVFQSKQSQRKGDWFLSLVPKHLQKYVSEGVNIDVSNKDSIGNAIRNWLCELGEIDTTFKKSELSALKAFISNSKDDHRVAYGRNITNFPRRTVFFGSVNDKKFLADDQNMRWWVLALREDELLTPLNDMKIDLQQLWAEIQVIYESGEPWYLLPEELKLLEISNEKHKIESFYMECMGLITDTFDFKNTDQTKTKEYRSSELLKIFGFNSSSGTMLREIGKALRTLKVHQNDNSKWRLPPLLSPE